MQFGAVRCPAMPFGGCVCVSVRGDYLRFDAVQCGAISCCSVWNYDMSSRAVYDKSLSGAVLSVFLVRFGAIRSGAVWQAMVECYFVGLVALCVYF